MTTSKARALASRRNGAKSRGPRTAAGRARAARNALKHGLCARTLVLLDDEDKAAFGAFEAAVHAELAPAGALEADLVARIVVAAWRARRGDRLEAALLGKFLRMARTDPARTPPSASRWSATAMARARSKPSCAIAARCSPSCSVRSQP